MPANAGMVDASSEQGFQEPGGASRHRLSGILSRFETTEGAEIIECKCIARWHDANSIALDADPTALVINSPLQSDRARCLVFLNLFLPFRCPVTSYQNQTLRMLPRGRPDRCCRLPRNSLRTPAQMSRKPISSMRHSEARSCAAENCEPANNTSRIGLRNTFSQREGRARSRKSEMRRARVTDGEATT